MRNNILGLVALLVFGLSCWAVSSSKQTGDTNLIRNGDFRSRLANGKPIDYQLEGSAEFCYPGNPRTDVSDWGAGLRSSGSAGSVAQIVSGIDIADGKWYRFTFRGLPQRFFAVNNDNLFMKVEFLGSDGRTTYDGKDKKIYAQIEQARKDLTVNGVRHNNGSEVWQTYQLDFCLPFPQVHQLKLSVGFGDGAASNANGSEFFVNDFKLMRIPTPADTTPADERNSPAIVPVYENLLPLGGRWFYAAAEGETWPPSKFDDSNANRLLYHDAGYSAPFAGNCSAWLHKGNVDLSGATFQTDRKVVDNLVISFDATSMVLRTHGLPNHPTGVFPGLNPSQIIEQIATYYIPFNPAENPQHTVTDKQNSNHALPMGPIGIAINGVVFFNPFDANSQDATDMMDRCCGHPNPMGVYHYHKYPICVNSPWADEGKEHSPLIGFAFDGYPVYGPYESKDVMAKDVIGEGALNAFNMTYDEARGQHYHVTPGKFPYIIGGYWGTEDPRDRQHGGRGMGMRGSNGGPPGSGNNQRGMGPPGGGPPRGGNGFGPPPGGQ